MTDTSSKIKTSAAFAASLVAMVGAWEGLRLNAYSDVVGVPTICYGETKGVRLGQHKTKPECDALFVQSLIGYEDGIIKCTKRKIPDNARLAFISLAYNIGVGGFCHSSVAAKFNAGNLKGACDAMLLYDRAGGVPWIGLTRRRHAERDICLKDVE